MEKNHAEKLKEARSIVLEADANPTTNFETECLAGAGYFLLGEVDRLAKIETGLQNLIVMKRQAHEALYEESVLARQPLGYVGPDAMELLEKAEVLRGEIYSLEALIED